MRDLTIAYSVSSKGRTLIRRKSIQESFGGSINFYSMIVECKRKLSVEVFGASTEWLTPKCKNNLYRQSQQRERNVTTCVNFDLTNKGTRPKS